MANYLVTWAVDIEDAESPREAAERALAMQRHPESIAVVFEVKEVGTDHVVTVDLIDLEEDPQP